jgi:hypothetical protein
VASDASVLEGYLNGALSGPDIDLLVDEGVRDTVVVLVELYVVVNVDSGLLPQGEFVWGVRQRFQDGLVQCLEEIAAGPAKMAHRTVVEFCEEFPDGLVQLCQAKEGAVS